MSAQDADYVRVLEDSISGLLTAIRFSTLDEVLRIASLLPAALEQAKAQHSDGPEPRTNDEIVQQVVRQRDGFGNAHTDGQADG